MYSALKKYFDLTCAAAAFIIAAVLLIDVLSGFAENIAITAAKLENEPTLVIDDKRSDGAAVFIGHGLIHGG